MHFSYWVAYVIYRRTRKGLARTINRMMWLNVALGLATVLVAVFILQGFRLEVSKKLYALTGHLQVRPYGNETRVDLRTGIYAAYQSDILNTTGLDFVQPYGWQSALLKVANRVVGVQLKGVDGVYPVAGGFAGLQEGRMLDFGKKKYAEECLLSTQVAEELHLSVGDTLVVHVLMNPPRYRKLAVVGLYRTAIEEIDARLVVMDLGLLRHLRNWHAHEADGLEVFLHPGAEITASAEGLFEKMNYGLQIVDVRNEYPQIFGWFALLDRNTYIFLTLIAAVAGFNMLALCMILVMERREMIRTLGALGAGRGWLRQMLFIHGLFWLGWGMLQGNGLALGFGWLQQHVGMLRLDATNYALDYVPIHIDGWMWLGVNVVLLLWLSFALWLPLSRITRPLKETSSFN